MNDTLLDESSAALAPFALGIVLGIFGVVMHAWLIAATLNSKLLRSKTNFLLLLLSVVDTAVCCGYVQV